MFTYNDTNKSKRVRYFDPIEKQHHFSYRQQQHYIESQNKNDSLIPK